MPAVSAGLDVYFAGPGTAGLADGTAESELTYTAERRSHVYTAPLHHTVHDCSVLYTALHRIVRYNTVSQCRSAKLGRTCVFSRTLSKLSALELRRNQNSI